MTSSKLFYAKTRLTTLHIRSVLLKRLLPLFFLLSFACSLVLNSFVPVIAQQPREEIRGVWMTSNDFKILRSREKVNQAMGLLRSSNFNTIYPVVWNSGYTKYPSQTAKRAGIPFFFKGEEGQDVLSDLINQAHSQNLLVIPWFEFGFMVPQSSELALKHPDWLTQKQNGSQTTVGAAGENAWLNPFHPQVQQFITQLVTEVVTQYNGDGIQFDDHMSLPREFGYDKYTAALYRKETGRNPPKNFKDGRWVKWRADKISQFMVKLNRTVKAKKPNAIFSVSPNYHAFAYKMQLQDWLKWVRAGIVDELIVQVYRNDLKSFVQNIKRSEMKETQQKIPTAVGIMAGLRNKPISINQIQSQVRASRQNGLGVSFFYYESLWNRTQESKEQRKAAFQAMFPQPAFRSAMR